MKNFLKSIKAVFFPSKEKEEKEEEKDDGTWFDEDQAWFPDARSSEEATTYWATRMRKM